jgi:AraC family L-rhamnose operon regulatory protein RhaS
MDLGGLIETGRGFTFGTTSYSNGGTYGTLPPGYLTLLIMHRGAARVTFDDRELSVVGGECGIVANQRFARFVYQKHIRTEVSWCETRLGPQASVATGPQGSVATKLPISDRMLALLKMGLEIGLESSAIRNELRTALGRALLAAYLFESRQSQEAGTLSRGLLRTRAFIHEHFSQDITLGRLAEIAAMTPNHLVAAFGRKFGTTPIRYLWKQRAAHAVHLLAHSGMSGSEIAYACGYKSPYHFSRHIRSVYDKSPTEIRQQKGFRAPSNTLSDVNDIAFDR